MRKKLIITAMVTSLLAVSAPAFASNGQGQSYRLTDSCGYTHSAKGGYNSAYNWCDRNN